MVQTYEYSNKAIKIVDEGEETPRAMLEKLMLWVGEKEMREFLIAHKLMRRRTSKKGLKVAKGKLRTAPARLTKRK